jgi:hypothetical protein
MRYVVVKESNRTWYVFDRVFSLPAQMGGLMLVGLSRHAAEREASKANEVRLRWMPNCENQKVSITAVQMDAAPVAPIPQPCCP